MFLSKTLIHVIFPLPCSMEEMENSYTVYTGVIQELMTMDPYLGKYN